MSQAGTPVRSKRDEIRSKVLSERGRRVIIEIDGMEIEVRQMTVGQMLDTVGVEDRRRQMAMYLINCCFVPGTEDKIFDDGDMEILMEMPAGGYYNRIMEKVQEQLLPAQMEVAGKS